MPDSTSEANFATARLTIGPLNPGVQEDAVNDMDSRQDLLEDEDELAPRLMFLPKPRFAIILRSCITIVGTVVVLLTLIAFGLSVYNFRKPAESPNVVSGCADIGREIAKLSKVDFNAYRMCSDDDWLVVMRRVEVKARILDFNRTWDDYKKGFGDSSLGRGEYWLGLDALHRLTASSERNLKIKMNWRAGAFQSMDGVVVHEGFAVANETDKYKLSIGKRTASDRLPLPIPDFDVFNPKDSQANVLNQMKFTTKDNQNDHAGAPKDNCAKRFSGGWWFNNCYYVCLTCGTSRAHWFDGEKWYYLNGVEMLVSVR